MKKIISLFLSVLLLYSSSLPLCAQTWQQRVDQAVYQAVQQTNVEEEIKQLVNMLQADPTDAEIPDDDFETFKSLYTQYIETVSMRQQTAFPQQRQALEQWKRKQLSAETITRVYQENQANFVTLFKQEYEMDLQRIRAYMQQLAAGLQNKMQTFSNNSEKRTEWEELVVQSYPLFMAMQGLTEQQRSWSATLLRNRLTRLSPDCAALSFSAAIKERFGHKVLADKEKSCQQAIESAAALSILGNTPDDQEALRRFLDQGKDGILAVSVLQVGTVGLLAMGAENELVQFLHTEITRFPSVWEMGLDSLDAIGPLWGFQTKLKLYKELTTGWPWVAAGHQNSYYKTDIQMQQHPVLGNAWTDIGLYLGQQAQAGNATAQAVIRRLAASLVTAAGPVTQAHIQLPFPALLGGILISGYHLPAELINGEKTDQLNANGSVTQVDTRPLWKVIAKDLEKEKLDLEGYLLIKLYLSGKSDVDPWTKAHFNNTLASAYYRQEHHRPAKLYLQTNQEPTAAQIEQYHAYHKQQKIAGYADIAAAGLGLLWLGVGAVRGIAAGSRHMLQLGKTIAIARGGQAMASIPSLSARVSRLSQLRNLRLNYINRFAKTFETSMSLPKLTVTQASAAPKKTSQRALEKLVLKSTRTSAIQQIPSSSVGLAGNKTAGTAKKVLPKFTLIPFENKTVLPTTTFPNHQATNIYSSLPPTSLRRPATHAITPTAPLSLPVNRPSIAVSEPSFSDLLTKNIAQHTLETKEELSALGRSLWYAKKHIFLPLLFSWQFSSAPTTFLPRILRTTETVRSEYVMRTISNLPKITETSVSGVKTLAQLKPVSTNSMRPVSTPLVKTASLPATHLFKFPTFTPILPVAAYHNEQLLKMGGAFHFSAKQPAVVRDYQQQMATYQRNQQLRTAAMPPAAQAAAITSLFTSATPLLNKTTSNRSAAASVVPLFIAAGSLLPQQAAAAQLFSFYNSLDVMSSGPLWGTAAILGAWGLIGSGIFKSDGLNQMLEHPVRAVNIPHELDLKHPVWKLKNILGKSIGYLKMTSVEEQERTQQFDQLIQQIDPASIDLLSIQYPKIKSIGWDKIPPTMRHRIQTQTAAIKVAASKRPETILQLSEVDTSGASLGSLSDETNIEAFMAALQYQPISFNEWNQLTGLIATLNQAGFEHTDLPANLWLKRLKNGTLQVTLLDFEKHTIFPGKEHDVDVLQTYQKTLQDYHLLRDKSVLDGSQNRPYYLSQADEKLENRLVWEVQNKFHKKIGYVKITDLFEMKRTKKFHELAQEKIPHLDLIEIDYPRVLSEGWIDLPRRIQGPLLEYGDKNFIAHNSVGPFIISSVDVSGFMPSLIATNKAMKTHAQHLLKGAPIMAVEWEQVLSFFRYLNEKGFNHGDLMHNLWIRRNAEGKLKISVLDFEYIQGIDPGYNDVQTLQVWERNLRDADLLQQNAPQGIPSWQRMFVGEPDF